MLSIWKYNVISGHRVQIPKGAKILTIQVQFDSPVIWALVDSKVEIEERIFNIYPTGNNIATNPGNYIGTYQLYGGNLIYHVFEEI